MLCSARTNLHEKYDHHDAAAAMLEEIEVRGQHITVGADKAYATRGFVRACRDIDVTPHVAQNLTRIGGSAIDGRTTVLSQ